MPEDRKLVLAAAIKIGTRGAKQAGKGLGDAAAESSSRDPLDAISGTFETAMKTVIKPVLDAVTALVGILAIGVFKYIKGIFEFVTNPLGFLKDKFSEKGKEPLDLSKGLVDVGKNLIGKVVNFFEETVDEGEKNFSELKDSADKNFSEMKTDTEETTFSLGEFLKKTWENVSVAVGGFISTMLNRLDLAVSEAENFTANFSDANANFSHISGAEINTLDPNNGPNFSSITGVAQRVNARGSVINNFYGLTSDEAILRAEMENAANASLQRSF